MELHRASKQPDWEKVPQAEHRIAQKIAAKTAGVVTPGNAVSVAGLFLTHSGLMDIKRSQILRGTAKVAVGRALDIADGYVADKTGTKSPLGEKVDATIDKILMADALWFLYKKDIIPTKAAILIGGQNMVNTVATAIATLRGNEIHSSREGKITTAMQWAAIGGYCIDAITHPDSTTEQGSLLRKTADGMTAISSALGAYVNVDYTQTALTQSVEEL